MATALHLIAAAVLLAIALYAQFRIASFTARPRSIVLTRLVLLVVGVLFGLVAVRVTAGPGHSLLTFLQAFGLAHVPAAVVLALKRARGEGRS